MPLNVIHTAHRANRETARICEEAGGAPFLARFTANFYKKAFADPHLDQFIRERGDHHGERFAYWIAEKARGRLLFPRRAQPPAAALPPYAP